MQGQFYVRFFTIHIVVKNDKFFHLEYLVHSPFNHHRFSFSHSPFNRMSNPRRLFIDEIDLPGEPELLYIKKFVDNPDELYSKLKDEVPWRQEEVVVFGKTFNQPRLTCFMGQVDKPYTYSGFTRTPVEMTPTMAMLTEKVQSAVNSIRENHPSYTSVLGNNYRNGHDYIGSHSDDEKDMIDDTIIASLSLGEERFFDITSKSTNKKELRLTMGNGSLIMMGRKMQTLYKHGVPKQLTKKEGRLNFTWRVMK